MASISSIHPRLTQQPRGGPSAPPADHEGRGGHGEQHDQPAHLRRRRLGHPPEAEVGEPVARPGVEGVDPAVRHDPGGAQQPHRAERDPHDRERAAVDGRGGPGPPPAGRRLASSPHAKQSKAPLTLLEHSPSRTGDPRDHRFPRRLAAVVLCGSLVGLAACSDDDDADAGSEDHHRGRVRGALGGRGAGRRHHLRRPGRRGLRRDHRVGRRAAVRRRGVHRRPDGGHPPGGQGRLARRPRGVRTHRGVPLLRRPDRQPRGRAGGPDQRLAPRRGVHRLRRGRRRPPAS